MADQDASPGIGSVPLRQGRFSVRSYLIWTAVLQFTAFSVPVSLGGWILGPHGDRPNLTDSLLLLRVPLLETSLLETILSGHLWLLVLGGLGAVVSLMALAVRRLWGGRVSGREAAGIAAVVTTATVFVGAWCMEYCLTYGWPRVW
jgi:hypothetical protein